MMARLGDTLRGERSIVGRTLQTTTHGLLGRQAITLEVASLAPLNWIGLPRGLRPAAVTEAAWAAGSDGSFYWVYFDHTTDEVLAAYETGQRTYA